MPELFMPGMSLVQLFIRGKLNMSRSWKIILDCETGPFGGRYNKKTFQYFKAEMTENQFNIFCKEILSIHHFYDTNQNAWATDKDEIINQFPPGRFWQLRPIL
jgi:hypothetical protein